MKKALFKKTYYHTLLPCSKYDDLWGSKGIFTTIRVFGFTPKFILLDQHIQNLNISLKKIGIKFSLKLPQLNKLILPLIKKNINYDHLMRIAVNSKKISITLRLRVKTRKFFTAKIVNYKRSIPELKNLYYKKIINLQKTINSKKQELLLTNDKLILEGATTNILCIKNGNIYMPKHNYYEGITLNYLIKKTSMEINKINISIYKLNLFDEILLVGSGKGVVSLSAIPEINWQKRSDYIFEDFHKIYNALI